MKNEAAAKPRYFVRAGEVPHAHPATTFRA